MPNEPVDTHLRYGQLSDIDNIQSLLIPYAEQGILLYKDKQKIAVDIPRTVVYSFENILIGVANLHKYDDTLYEVRGFAVHPDYQKRGIGKKIINKLLEDLKKEFPNRHITIFALTVVPDFFKSIGWRVVLKEKFPRKIFDDCSFCTKKENCFEDAVEIIV